MPETKRVIVAIGIVVNQGRILICRRRDGGAFAGYWEFPGGKCEPGESPADCVTRELFEELEIRVRPTHPLPPIEHDYPGRHVTIHPFLCAHESGTPRAISAAEFRWAPIDTLRDYRFPEANADLIQTLVRQRAIDPY